MTDEAQRTRWNDRFSGEDYLFGTAPNAFLASQQRLLRGVSSATGGTALAIADGEGRNGVFLAEQGLDVLSIDFSPVGLEKAKKLAAQRGVRLRTELADLFAWDWSRRSFDVVVAIFVQFATPPERARLFEHLKGAVKKGGLLLLQGYRPEQLQYGTGGPPHAENMYTATMLREVFADMTILHLAEHDDVILEGKGHAGMSALVDMVARK
ncbi:MAG: methyltransferase domain-containing protein [Alphaproteobacteria bacterium]|nr:methyltransferase domain-containing protein [Alphaproteobacteria bacterium]